ncbi:aminotransferase class III-fold pyridoxal phosphate-dependent enzyme [Bradyrhizobium xenonodulans]|uniref:Aminotransferase class III-fold pyridoxal phosphate-dependent enzyme n=1 Tax=Bradyrhizobium xenonodulans TaxID=2736875 RepID=A0ABY7MJJ4_9BRAD|nr:aminotransferase class III-fold pyridoxal phosphate-dependent enzyme [Bradyrhizobium xenonodulans]WBL78121.1 aminotransferase class III-fold pyridoxal phosphate-dependent enzyme [Bradyrhizobium xenonodulans]
MNTRATFADKARRGLEADLGGVVRLPFEGYRGAGIGELERFADMASDPSGGIDPVAAIIVETVQGEGGLNVASEPRLQKLSQVASGLGALLIVDEIQAGCCGTGRFFGFERSGIVPDLICLSKSISGAGLPMSLLLVAPQFDTWRPGEHNGTFRGNSLAFVAAAQAVDEYCEPDFVAGISARAVQLEMAARRGLEISARDRRTARHRHDGGIGISGSGFRPDGRTLRTGKPSASRNLRPGRPGHQDSRAVEHRHGSVRRRARTIGARDRVGVCASRRRRSCLTALSATAK